MEFLKRHYEKVILFGFFLLFIGLMFWVMRYIDVSSEVSESDLNFVKQQANYENVNPKDNKFNSQWLWKDSTLKWARSAERDKRPINCGQFSDLVQMFPLALCPYCSQPKDDVILQRKYLIPFAAFGAKCPRIECNHHALIKPAEVKRAKVRRKSESDRDGDGIPNEKEKEFGLNAEDPNDALFDLDLDGFSNLYEFENGTDPRNASSHPEFWYRLHVVNIDQRPLPFIATTINENESNKKTDWEVQINEDRPGRSRPVSRILRIGDTIRIERKEYKITDIERHYVTRTETVVGLQGGTQRQINRSKIYLEEELFDAPEGAVKDKLVMTVGSQLMSSDKRPKLCDSGITFGKNEYDLKVGDRIRVGVMSRNAPRTAYDQYQLHSVDAEKKTATLRVLVRNGKRLSLNDKPELVVITEAGKIPPDYRVITNQSNSGVPGEML